MRVIVTPYDARISQTIPHSKTVERNGREFNVIPHCLTEAKLLRNFGYTIPAPILSQYDWCNTSPFESQKVTASMLTEQRRAYVLNDMGTGKTRAALYAADYLMNIGEARKALIIAPLSTLSTVWDREVFDCFPHRDISVLYGSREKRIKRLEEDVDFYVINHDGVKVIEAALAKRTDIDIVIVDELALLRNVRTALWKTTNRVIKGRKFVWGMTGSPTPKAPTDAFGQVKLLTPERVGWSFKHFQLKTMHQVTQFKWVAKSEANKIVHAAMQPSVRYTRADCIDLPKTTYTTHEVQMTKEQVKAYKEMYKEMYLLITDPQFSGAITAANAGVRLSKLMQIGAGFAYGLNDDGTKNVALFDAKPREALLRNIIDEASGKVIVFSPYIYTVNSLTTMLRNYLTAEDVSEIHGGTSKAQRDLVFNNFQFSSAPRVIVAHPKTMSHGLTLTAADTIVWYSPTFSLETYEQANARITRPGQNLHTHIIHIQASEVEKKVYNTLQQRGSLQAALLRLFRGQ